MRFVKSNLFVVVLTVVALGSCDFHSARDEFDQQLEFCTLAENNGLLESAVRGCEAALVVAEKEGYAPDVISNLLYRLGRMARQRNQFTEAEELMRRSLAIVQQSGEQTAVAVRLIDLSLSLAGQGHWADGAQLLDRASLLSGDLAGRDRKAAAGAFRLFSVRLHNLGETTLAEDFQATSQELARPGTQASKTDATAASPVRDN